MSDEYKGDLGELVSKILARPDLVAQIADMLGTQEDRRTENAPLDQAEATPSAAEPQEPEVTKTVPAEPPQKGQKDAKRENRRQLLAALRPFLSEGRQNALDSIESVATLLEITRS